mgnify:CR=1 FL=1
MNLHRCLVTGLLAASAAAQTLVIPPANANTEGNSSNTIPLDSANARSLHIYDSSHFTNNGVTFPIVISQLRWRANGATATWSGASPTLQVDLSTSPINYTAISTTWNANHGIDRATVFSGAWNIPAGSSTAGQLGPYYATCAFTTPFLYDPNSGDLVIDITCLGNTTANTPTTDSVTTAGVALGRRVYSTSNPPAATGTLGTGEFAHVFEIAYTPASGLYAAFTADVTGGASPLAVNFSDQSFSSAPGGITSWAWDFDNNGSIDSTLPNPSHVYTACGTYTVALTVTDGVHPPSTQTKTAYINTDVVTAGFTDQLVGPLLVVFTDTSTPTPTSWDWDLDGDGLTDSTAQNPAWSYANTSPVNVRLTASRLCGPPSTITKTVVPAQQLTTSLTVNNSVGAPATLYFNMDVLNPAGVSISAFDSISSTLNTACTVDIFMKPGSYIGSEFNAAAWSLVATATGTSSAVANTPFPTLLPQPWYVPAGSYGIAMRYVGVTPRYFGTGTGPLYNIGNGDIALTLGAASLSTAGPFTGTNINTPRMWAGTIYYGTHNLTSQAGYGFFGPGCAGTLPASRSTLLSPPVLGGTLSVQYDNMPQSVGVIVVGLSNTTSVFGPLPADLGQVGAPGCLLRVSPDATGVVSSVPPATTVVWNFGIPTTATLSGAVAYSQMAVYDPLANAFSAVMGDAAGWVLGL